VRPVLYQTRRLAFIFAAAVSAILFAFTVMIAVWNFKWQFSFGHLRVARPSGLEQTIKGDVTGQLKVTQDN
jgi:hypothetical protein